MKKLFTLFVAMMAAMPLAFGQGKFEGSMRVQLIFQMRGPGSEVESQDQPVQGGMPLTFRASFKGSRMAIDSVMFPLLAAKKDFQNPKVVMDYEAKTFSVGAEDNGQKKGFFMDFAKQYEQQRAESEKVFDEAMFATLEKKLDSMGVSLKFNVSDEQTKIEGYTCRRITLDAKMFSMDLWVSKEINLNMSDFTKMYDAKDKAMQEKAEKAFKKLFGEFPAELKGAFPLRIVMKVKDPKASKVVAGMMLNITNIRPQADVLAFDMSGYNLKPFEEFQKEMKAAKAAKYAPAVEEEEVVEEEPAPAPAPKKAAPAKKATPAKKSAPAKKPASKAPVGK